MTKPGKAGNRRQRNPTRASNYGWHFPSLTFGYTYFDLHREFHHKNKLLPAFLWCHWSLCLLDLPTPSWVQEPVPEKEKLIIEFEVLCSICFLTNLEFIRRFNSSYQVFSKHVLCALQHSFVWERIMNVIRAWRIYSEEKFMILPIRREVDAQTRGAPGGLPGVGWRNWGVLWSCYHVKKSIPGKQQLNQEVTPLRITTLAHLRAFTVSGSTTRLLHILLL